VKRVSGIRLILLIYSLEFTIKGIEISVNAPNIELKDIDEKD
jgi:hypothetical protein